MQKSINGNGLVPSLSRKEKFKTVIAVLGLAYIWHVFWPYVLTGGQDSCSFGPVSNARYREMLAEAKQKQITVWPSLEKVWGTGSRTDRSKSGQSLELYRRARELGVNGNVYEQIAAIHAVMRALNGRIRYTTRHLSSSDTKNEKKLGLSFYYTFDPLSSRFFNLRIGNFGHSARFMMQNVYGGYRPFVPEDFWAVSVLSWNLLDHFENEGLFYSDYPPPPAGGPCPHLPDPALMPPEQLKPSSLEN